MATTVHITQEDISGLARKLDEFSAVLSERERAIMIGMLGLVQKELNTAVAARPTEAQGPLPPLSAGFQTAFAKGVGRTFTIQESGATQAEAGGVGIGIVY